MGSVIEGMLAAVRGVEATLSAATTHHWVAAGSDEFVDVYTPWDASLRAGLEELQLLAIGVSEAGASYDEAESAVARSFPNTAGTR